MEIDPEHQIAQLWALGFVLLTVAVAGAGLTWAILRAAKYPQPIMLIIVMSLLTISFVGVYVVVDDSEAARQVVATMAATSLGALVTATATTFRERKDSPPVEPEDEDQSPSSP